MNPDGEIVLHPELSVSWKSLSDRAIPELPEGTQLDIEISFKENLLLSGKDGIVWATFDFRQAEIITNALLPQSISSVIGKIEMKEGNLMLIRIVNDQDIEEAMDFIWRKDSGLRLKADWTYAKGEPNMSFEKWLNE